MINFTKMHGLGNDFICINRMNDENIIASEKMASFTRYICNRNFGVGADGVIFIDNSEIADCKMTIYNRDGSQAEMCGNGIRCLVKYLYDNKVIKKQIIEIETLAGIRKAFLDIKGEKVQNINVCMGEPVLENNKIPVLTENIGELSEVEINIENKKFIADCISIGNPHAVIVVDNVDSFEVEKYGSRTEILDIFPNNTNVEFVQILDKGNIKMRVWERGTGETFACGTGACAVAVVCNLKGLTRRNVTVALRGGELKIECDDNTNEVYMSGIATKVFDGQIEFN